MDTYGHLNRASGHKTNVLTFLIFFASFLHLRLKNRFFDPGPVYEWSRGRGGGANERWRGSGTAITRQIFPSGATGFLFMYFTFFKDTGVPTNAKKKVLLKRVFLNDRQLKVSCSLQELFFFFSSNFKDTFL
jgi:hypothetical protein